MWFDGLKESFFQAVKWLDICSNNGIILNPEKFQFGNSTVEFPGFTHHSASLRTLPRGHPTLSHPTEHHQCQELVWTHQPGVVHLRLSRTLAALRKVLKKDTRFQWTDELERLFQESKALIISEIYQG